MPLASKQVQVGTLVMGPGTSYEVLPDFNPWVRLARADQSGSRPWNHGGWSGAEFAEPSIVPIRIQVRGSGPGGWLTSHQALAAAFAPSSTDIELRWAIGGSEYVMFGRPRLVEPQSRTIGVGFAFTRCAFVALDPRIYAGTASTTGALSLPSFTGGLTVPFTVPFTIDTTLTGGEASAVNAGTTDTGLTVTIAGPISSPRFSVQRPDSTVETLEIQLDLSSGQTLVIDTEARTVLLGGDPSASRRGLAVGTFPLLPPGTSTITFRAGTEDTGTLTATWRSAWW